MGIRQQEIEPSRAGSGGGDEGRAEPGELEAGSSSADVRPRTSELWKAIYRRGALAILLSLKCRPRIKLLLVQGRRVTSPRARRTPHTAHPTLLPLGKPTHSPIALELGLMSIFVCPLCSGCQCAAVGTVGYEPPTV